MEAQEAVKQQELAVKEQQTPNGRFLIAECQIGRKCLLMDGTKPAFQALLEELSVWTVKLPMVGFKADKLKKWWVVVTLA